MADSWATQRGEWQRSLRAGEASAPSSQTPGLLHGPLTEALACSLCARLHSPFSSVTPSDELINTAISPGTLWLNAVDREGGAWGGRGG